MDTQSGHSQCPLSQKSRLKTASIHIEDLDGVVSSTTCQLQPLAALFGVLSSFAHALPPTQPLDDKSVTLAETKTEALRRRKTTFLPHNCKMSNSAGRCSLKTSAFI